MHVREIAPRRIVVPWAHRNWTLYLGHSSKLASYSGVCKSLKLVIHHYWWLIFSHDVNVGHTVPFLQDSALYFPLPTVACLVIHINFIFYLRGLSQHIISDRGVQFPYKFWWSLCGLLDIKHNLFFVYHLQTKEGQVDHVKQVLGNYFLLLFLPLCFLTTRWPGGSANLGWVLVY